MELKPCPFCGSAGKMFKAEWLTPDMRYTTYQFGCENEDCPCSANRFSTACTEEKAIEAWNTRAELTAKPTRDKLGFAYCGECGWNVGAATAPFRYCSHCGRKVEE